MLTGNEFQTLGAKSKSTRSKR